MSVTGKSVPRGKYRVEESAGFVQLVTEEVRTLRVWCDKLERRTDDLAEKITEMQMGKIHTLELKVATIESGALLANREAIERLASGQLWLSRLVIGAVITGAIGLLLKLLA